MKQKKNTIVATMMFAIMVIAHYTCSSPRAIYSDNWLANSYYKLASKYFDIKPLRIENAKEGTVLIPLRITDVNLYLLQGKNKKSDEVLDALEKAEELFGLTIYVPETIDAEYERLQEKIKKTVYPHKQKLALRALDLLRERLLEKYQANQ